MNKTHCKAKVQAGRGTYALRNGERSCANAAKANGYCATHQRFATIQSIAQRESFDALRAQLAKDAR